MWYSAGDVISVRVSALIVHEGIMTEHGRVISNSRRRGGVYEESVRAFAEGRKVRNRGALSGVNPNMVLARARSMIGRGYDPVNFNCEHFVRTCYGKSPHSPQKRLAIGTVALAALIAAL